MKILLLDTFFAGSHKKWAAEFKAFSKHDIEILLSESNGQWRMHGGAISLTNNSLSEGKDFGIVDLILATDTIDLHHFLSLTRTWSHNIPTAIYFHENQLSYPWQTTEEEIRKLRDNHFAFINYSSALTADHVFFNSQYHHDAFLGELPKFLKAFPDNRNLETIEAIRKKSSVLPLALDLQKFDKHKPAIIEKPNRAVVLWNHRWEYDKNPSHFFNTLFQLAEHGIDFRLVVLGKSDETPPPVFDEAKEKLANKILHFGYVESFDEYCKWLWIADIIPVTSTQDFFGGSVIEAMYCNVVPFLPKRLAYPEHIPVEFHQTFFYDEEDFAAKLQRRIMDVKYLRVMDTQQYARKYDWSNLIEMYDAWMEEVNEYKNFNT
jgi:glycosyltransferase involved in cell wall biosynthesis